MPELPSFTDLIVGEVDEVGKGTRAPNGGGPFGASLDPMKGGIGDCFNINVDFSRAVLASPHDSKRDWMGDIPKVVPHTGAIDAGRVRRCAWVGTLGKVKV